MKISISNIVICLTFWIISPCYAQNKLFNTVWADLKKVEKLTKDPVILIGPEKSFSINTVKIKSDANVIAWEWYYLLYRHAGKNYVYKHTELLENYNGKKVYKSQPIEFVNDSLFAWVSSQKNHIQQEEILPFVYLDTALNVPVYKKGFNMHTFPIELSVHFPTDSGMRNYASFKFDEIALQPTLLSGYTDIPKNLNFEYNRQLTIYKLYMLLTRILSDYTDRFKFR
jgi:hypothetical protein